MMMSLRDDYHAYTAAISGEPLTFREWYIARQRYSQLAREDWDYTPKDRRWHEVNALELLLLENGDTIVLDDSTREGLLEGVVRPYDPKLSPEVSNNAHQG